MPLWTEKIRHAIVLGHMADLQLLLPAQVQVTFRTRRCYGTWSDDPPPALYSKSVDLSDTTFAGDLDPVPQGVPQTVQIVHSTALALYSSSGGDPTNQTTLDDLATRIAEDHYGWLARQVHLACNGVAVPSPLSAVYDLIEIQYDDADAVTILQSAGWTGAAEELQQHDPANANCTDTIPEGDTSSGPTVVTSKTPYIEAYAPLAVCAGGVVRIPVIQFGIEDGRLVTKYIRTDQM